VAPWAYAAMGVTTVSVTAKVTRNFVAVAQFGAQPDGLCDFRRHTCVRRRSLPNPA
jgi:hypothetical protein